MNKNLRYAIATNKAVNMGQVNPDVLKFGFNLISSNAYYKVLDVYAIVEKIQVLLLHFDTKYLDIFGASIKTKEKE